MTDQEVQKLKVGDFLTWTDEDENRIYIGRILRITRYHGKNFDRKWWGRISHAEVLVFPVWSNDHYRNLASMCAAELKYATFSTQIEIDVWMKAAEEYFDAKQRELELIERGFSRAVVKSRILPMEEVKWDYRRNPPKPNCSWNWLWSKAKSSGLWKPSPKELQGK